MAELPDIYCWIKLIDQTTGQVLLNGSELERAEGSIIIRYVVANDSNQATGPFKVVGTLRHDNQPLPHPVPPITLQLQPQQVWTHEHIVPKQTGGHFVAAMLAEAGNLIAEENEANNQAAADFYLYQPPS